MGLSTPRSLTLLDSTGDTTISWDEDTDEKILDIIKRKMEEGFVFYIIKPVPFRKITRLGKAKNIEEIRKAGSVTICDKALEDLFFAGEIGITKAPDNDNIEMTGKAKTPQEVVSNQTVGVRPARGG